MKTKTPVPTNLMNTTPSGGEVDIGLYRITVYPTIGGGAFGHVCKAVRKDTLERVAAKGIRYSWDDENDDMCNVALAEAENMKRIRHENIVPLIDYESHEGTVWIFMELCEQGDLDRYMRRHADMTFARKCNIMVQIASAVNYLHSLTPPIIHRDIKPQNVLMKHDENGAEIALLSDFGFAKLFDRSFTLTGSKFYFAANISQKGTPHYMAPEFFLLESSSEIYTTAVDIFGLGLLYVGLLEVKPGCSSTLPLSVEALAQRRGTAYGYELSECYKTCRPFPHIVELQGTEEISVLETKQLILQMTTFEAKKRIGIEQVVRTIRGIYEGILDLEAQDSHSPPSRRPRSSSSTSLASVSSTSSLDLFPLERNGALRHKKTIKLSLFPLGLKLIGNELWSCQADGIAVYSRDLHHLRTLRKISNLGFMYSAALLKNGSGHVIVASVEGLRVVTKDGTSIKQVAEGLHWDVIVQGSYCFACPARLPAIDIYKYNTNFEKIRIISLPCQDLRCASLAHTLTVRENLIYVCCSGKNLIYVLDISANGNGSLVKARYGPEVQYTMVQHGGQYRNGGGNSGSNTASTSRMPTTQLVRPHICHLNEDGSVIVANTVRHRLLVLDTEGNIKKWKMAGMKRPIGAVKFKERLYVSTWGDRCITMFSKESDA